MVPRSSAVSASLSATVLLLLLLHPGERVAVSASTSTSIASVPCDPTCQYINARDALYSLEHRLSFDHGMVLDQNERAVEALLNMLRTNEIARFDERAEFLTAVNFRYSKDEIENTKTFSILSTMPKGGLLHTHAFGDSWFLLKLGSYDTDCWINLGHGSTQFPKHIFIFSSEQPASAPGVQWKNVPTWRSEHSNPEYFDREVLYPIIQYYTPANTVSQDDMWDYFDLTITRFASLASKESVWRTWVLDGLQKLSDDGVIHVELRGFMDFICLPGTRIPKYNRTEMVSVWKGLLEDHNSRVMAERQISIRFINAVPRTISVDALKAELLETVQMQLNNSTSGLVVGFDLVDEEDRYNSLIYYLDAWLFIANYLKERGLPPMSYYFHAAETDWYRDQRSNLYDALLLNTTRIGHGFSLLNYPLLQTLTKERQIAIEVCPISNQLLRVVGDIREHPAREMLSNGVDVTISNDDSVIYGYNGLTYDFWMAFHSWNLTLSGLKKLTQNGIQHSALPNNLKQQKLLQMDSLWKTWIQSNIKLFVET